MNQNKTTKYFKYAIGEIILVVIGILIALSINNWNDAQNKEKKTVILLNDVLKEMYENIEKSTDKLSYFHEKDSVFNAIMYKKVTKETYLSDKFPEFKYMMNNSKNIELLEESFNVLMANMDNAPLQYKNTIKNLSYLYKVLQKEAVDWNKKFINAFQEYVKYESENYPWFSEYSEKGNQPILDYYLTNNEYRNRVAYMHDIIIHNLLIAVLKFRKAAITNYLQIAHLLELKIDSKDMVWTIRNPKFYSGTYQLESYIKNGFIWGNKKPKEQVTIFENNKRLFIKSPTDTIKYEVLPFSKGQFMTENYNFYTIKINQGDTLLEESSGTVYKKTITTND